MTLIIDFKVLVKVMILTIELKGDGYYICPPCSTYQNQHVTVKFEKTPNSL